MKIRPSLPIALLATSISAVAQETNRENSPTRLPLTTLDEVVVTGNRSGQTRFEQIQETSILKGHDLLLNLEPSLGETLRKEPGVSSTYFGPGSSRPVLRGLGDDRVRVLQNGTSVLDVSNVSPDHAVGSDPLSLAAIEVVRGPATLLYGPNTVGGAVNILDNRIATERFEGTYPTGKFGIFGGSVDDSLSTSGSLTWGTGPLVFTLDGFRRETEDIDIPGFARSSQLRATDSADTEQPRGTLPNSFTDSEGGGIGVSYIFENGYLGLSYSGLNSDYGTVGEPDVTIGLEQRRWDARGGVYNPTDWLREVNFAVGYADYTHTEFEGSEVGTVFDFEGFNGRLEFLHEAIGGFEGTFGYEVQATDFSALGDEAFVPPVDSVTQSLFFLEEKDFGPVRLQLGARYDHQSHESRTNENFGPGIDRDFDAFSASAGLIYNPTEDYAIALSLGYTQRPPTYVELFANGPHVATSTFEVGDVDLDKEEAFSVDLSLRKKSGWVTGSVSAFYNRFNGFITLQPTGAFGPEGELPVFNFEDIDADFYGGEVEATFHLLGAVDGDDAEAQIRDATRLDLTLSADYVRAEDRDSGEGIPRIPPFTTSAALEFGNRHITARVEGEYAAEQNRNAEFELPTDSYFLLGASLSYHFETGPFDSTLYVKGVNLTDEEARLSTSFLKDVAPLAGRGFIAGLRTEF